MDLRYSSLSTVLFMVTYISRPQSLWLGGPLEGGRGTGLHVHWPATHAVLCQTGHGPGAAWVLGPPDLYYIDKCILMILCMVLTAMYRRKQCNEIKSLKDPKHPKRKRKCNNIF